MAKVRIRMKEKRYSLNIEGKEIDLNSGMIEAITNPSTGFISKCRFLQKNIAETIKDIDWFSNCGKPITLNLTMEIIQVGNWQEAIKYCSDDVWADIELEAQNQLTVWLFINDKNNYQGWNNIVDGYKNAIVTPLCEEKIMPFQKNWFLDYSLVYCIQWDILAALMENHYIPSGHSTFFFLELFELYKSGYFPCGWLGNWPNGKLLVY